MNSKTFLSICLLLLLFGCSLPGSAPPPASHVPTPTSTPIPVILESVDISLPRLKMRPGQTLQCLLTAFYDNGRFFSKTTEADWSKWGGGMNPFNLTINSQHTFHVKEGK